MNLRKIQKLPYFIKQEEYSKWHSKAIKLLEKEYAKIQEFKQYTFQASGKIIDGRKFVEAHMIVVKNSGPNKRLHCYIYRLIEYLKFLNQ